MIGLVLEGTPAVELELGQDVVGAEEAWTVAACAVVGMEHLGGFFVGLRPPRLLATTSSRADRPQPEPGEGPDGQARLFASRCKGDRPVAGGK